jgi:hypothetical protein
MKSDMPFLSAMPPFVRADTISMSALSAPSTTACLHGMAWQA